MRSKIVAGNWKMNQTLAEGKNLTQAIKDQKKNIPNEVKPIIIPPFIHLSEISKILDPSSIKLGAQNCADEEKGAYTGEVSAQMIQSTGAQYVIIGHSERRAYFHEDDKTLLKKLKLAIKHDLYPILCCGESLRDREENQHFDVVSRQLNNSVFDLEPMSFSRVIIAYEPVWAIGTGKTATPEIAQEMHNHIRNLVQVNYTEEAAKETVILYGGSCKPSNAKELFRQPDIDGGLIGGASLKPEDFLEICKSFPKT